MRIFDRLKDSTQLANIYGIIFVVHHLFLIIFRYRRIVVMEIINLLRTKYDAKSGMKCFIIFDQSGVKFLKVVNVRTCEGFLND